MSLSNIWTAASEGDLDRVKHLIENEGLSPNAFDDNSYSPLHAAASWSHLEILRYLIQKGGDINLADEDGETCLFVVEDVDMARIIVRELGGDFNKRNNEGLNAAEHLQEAYPHISLYLRSLTDPSIAYPPTNVTTTTATATSQDGDDLPMSTGTEGGGGGGGGGEPDLDTPTDTLLLRVREIMQASERGELTAQQTDDQLRGVVEQAVTGQVQVGRVLGQNRVGASEDLTGSVRSRVEAEVDANGEEVEPEAKRTRAEAEGR
ncbi:BQ2448_2704 [Microbotryum intermedium]|uniref:BQ2448_2704 protein n=1 Tax=Microbotryum intermedium TaxID=269621 RepID=A0A238FJ68_9BASI|nr:BQ2448_2704 [Microbotryum intermedium]